ncbi:dethiobiotin synthase [Polynucleobacter sp. Latsch14-2]|uniref:dethiobiotin synthase n=1 Tax=Polynucleobacter sp. Latsch14-2 TaxID=2576920 RepID=UPI001C0B2704|nr:dethiobiotin synthase [Polynucleobacter sp. Latsch14-2]MBU3613847.1 dethiobiotin synthase [Polynucleobacter sp. Latsch14-2]
MNPNHQSSGFFITGTDTGVGKTLISGALILKLRETGLKVAGFKPVVAGTYQALDEYELNEDLETLRLASNMGRDQHNLCPYILKIPAAPHLAAQLQGVNLNIAVITKAFQAMSAAFDSVIVEGAGGFLVPLNDREDLGDVTQAIGLPVILVVGMRLGCINHALLTYEALKIRNIEVAGWVANTLSEEMPLLQENIQTLSDRISSPCLGVIPPLPKTLRQQVNKPYSLPALQFVAEHIKLPKVA